MVEGVIVGENSVISMGVTSARAPHLRPGDRRGQLRPHPAGSVVISGSLPRPAAMAYSLYAAIIVKKVDDAQTRSKTSINELLRD